MQQQKIPNSKKNGIPLLGVVPVWATVNPQSPKLRSSKVYYKNAIFMSTLQKSNRKKV